MPKLRSIRRELSKGEKRRGVKPPAWRAGQKRLPGRPKWRPMAAVYRPGLMPTKRTMRFLATRSGTVLLCAARSWALVGFQAVTKGRSFRRVAELARVPVHAR